MQALRIDANVASDHTVTIKLPSDVPVGPPEVILLYGNPAPGIESGGNGPAILSALSHSRTLSKVFGRGQALKFRKRGTIGMPIEDLP